MVFFNPNSLLELSWLKGKITEIEYQQAIKYINQCAAQSIVGMRNTILWTKNIPEREHRTTEAIQEAIKKINDKHKSIRCCLGY
jgi:hypothetical protein